MTTLTVSVEVSTPSGSLQLNQTPYQLAKETLGQRSVSHRRQEVRNPFVEGAYVVNSLRENIIEPISFYVRGVDHASMEADLEVAKAAFDQAQFELRRIIEGVEELWQCFSSDYTVTTQNEFLFARMAKMDVQVVRHPGAAGWANQVSGFWAPA